ncbi:RimJ/RimL family protein N-acetyltransferase [Hydrogenispora ethanolica]|jgi:RimJ/RimL family protein N-acetyltransferase|uniref:RimJ/RimL family protein N-acetyltransferase n=1 Tax=Hydrogenispora ethanolica TaxID=1082276 RepID=A0A4R1R782_HYDET|nr:GNAT family protein [Hydrogenispora ethanolica]TCL61465.1 RimJ/RimL family protein N-acetyltransferase [Hydrogenispora ethanolica]
MAAPILRTKRLILKALEEKDADRLFAYRSDPEVYRYKGWKPRLRAEAVDFIRRNTVEFDRPGTWFQLGIYDRDSLELVGDAGLHFLEPEGLQVEIGYTIAPPHQRQGLAGEAVREVIGYLFRVMRKHRIIASVDPENAASLALAESLGLRREGHFRKSVWNGDYWEDDVIYAILAEEWSGTSGAIPGATDHSSGPTEGGGGPG